MSRRRIPNQQYEPGSPRSTLENMEMGEVLIWDPVTPDRIETDRKEFHRQAGLLGWMIKTQTLEGDRLKLAVIAKQRVADSSEWAIGNRAHYKGPDRSEMSNLTSELDYGVFLRDLKARRDQLDAAIQAIEGVVGAGVGSSRTTVASTDASADDAFFGLTVLDGAIKLLRMMKRPLGATQIAERLEQGGFGHHYKNLASTIYATLDRAAMVEHGVVKVGRRWGLVEWYPDGGLNQLKPLPDLREPPASSSGVRTVTYHEEADERTDFDVGEPLGSPSGQPSGQLFRPNVTELSPPRFDATEPTSPA
jgi:hypothetical protein